VQAITGIARITNFDETLLGEKDESDDELRARTREVLRSLGKGTLAAIKRAILEERAQVVDVWDPDSATKQSDPGNITLLIEVKPGRFDSVRSVVEETRAAGVLLTLVARYIFVKPRVLLTLSPGLTAAGKLKVVDQVIQAVGEYLDALPTGQTALGKDMML